MQVKMNIADILIQQDKAEEALTFAARKQSARPTDKR